MHGEKKERARGGERKIEIEVVPDHGEHVEEHCAKREDIRLSISWATNIQLVGNK